MPSRLVLRYNNTCSGANVQTVVCSGNEPNQNERQETEWGMESGTVIRQDMSATAEIAAQPCWKEGKVALFYTIIVFAYRICSKLPRI
jgi:hypothetical protein